MSIRGIEFVVKNIYTQKTSSQMASLVKSTKHYKEETIPMTTTPRTFDSW